MGNLHRLFNIPADVGHHRRVADEHPVFIVEKQAAEIQVDRTDRRAAIVPQHQLAVNETGGIFVNLHPVFHQMPIIVPVDQPDIPVIADGGGADAHIHAAPGRQAEGGAELLIDDQIRGGQPQILPRASRRLPDEIQRGIFRIVIRAVGIRLKISLGFYRFFNKIIAVIALLISCGNIPHLEKNHRQAAHRAALQADTHILPVPQLGVDIDIFVRQIDAAGIPHLSIDHHDFFMVAVVQIKAGNKAVGGAEHRHLEALGLQLLIELVRNFEKAAHIVIEKAHLYPLSDFPQQKLVHPVPQLTGSDDEIFDKYKPFRPFHVSDEPFEILLTDGEILRGCVGIQRILGFGERMDIGGVVGIPGGKLIELRLIGRQLHEAVLKRRVQRALFLFIKVHPAPQPVKRHADDRRHQHHHDPGQPVGGAVVSVNQAEHRHHGQNIERHIEGRRVGPQEIGSKHHDAQLQQNGQGDDADADVSGQRAVAIVGGVLLFLFFTHRRTGPFSWRRPAFSSAALPPE